MVMEAETAVAEEVTTEQVVEPEAPKAEVEEQEAEPTLEELKAQLATERKERTAAENRLKSTQGQLKGKLDTEAFQSAVRRELAQARAYLQAVAKGQIAGDPAVTETEMAKAQQTSQQEEYQVAFVAQAEDLTQQIREDMEDAGLEATAPELAEANRVWDDWLRTKDLGVLRQAAKMTREVRRNVQVAAWEKEQADARKKSGSLSTPNIRASGNGSGMTWQQAQKIKSVKDLSDEAYAKLVGS